ncbi:hypothetical protein [Botryobacter ruber]|uniref:hypothetical protein n=1 Tax=Botryobacter ruber TaxID=2171629 RepID=UPI000F653CFF|nr:hypothetical protein [Botryobacter ruber]
MQFLILFSFYAALKLQEQLSYKGIPFQNKAAVAVVTAAANKKARNPAAKREGAKAFTPLHPLNQNQITVETAS